MSLVALLLWNALLLALVFAAAFVVSKRLNNYGIVDAVWSYSFTPVLLLGAALSDGWGPRRWVVLAATTLWSVRLGTHLATRIASHHPHEDRRYAALRELWKDGFVWKMAGFFQAQGAFVLMLALPLLLALQNTETQASAWEWAGLSLWVVAWCGESIADGQLKRFKRENMGKLALCEMGLWRFSRHPNYFFEWLNWVAFALIAWPAPQGYLGLLSPVVMLHLLLNVTGIPMTEEQSVAKYGDLYRVYQRRTSAFVPWFRRGQ